MKMIPSPKKAVTSQKSRKDTNELMQGLQEAVSPPQKGIWFETEEYQAV